jgi:hypothetical protein
MAWNPNKNNATRTLRANAARRGGRREDELTPQGFMGSKWNLEGLRHSQKVEQEARWRELAEDVREAEEKAEEARDKAAGGRQFLWEPIPTKRVIKAQKDYGWGSPEHVKAMAAAQLSMKLYLEGKRWKEQVEKAKRIREEWGLGGWELEEIDRPSPQERILYRQELEILVGGAKGGGKTRGGMMWMIRGNVLKPWYDAAGVLIPVNESYIYHPRFHGLVLRENEKDLEDWVEEAKEFYCGALGARWVGRPDSVFRWPTGARVSTGHLANADSYRKYWGKTLHRIIIEELTHIAEQKTYFKIRGCCRSPFPEIRPQMLSTTNPPGAGQAWVFNHFIEPKIPSENDSERLVPCRDADGVAIKAFDGEGNPYYPEPVVVRKAINPFTGEEGEIRSVFIPARLEDNPHLLGDDSYVMNLATGDEEDREALLLGRWNVQGGSYFKTFRPKGPIKELEEPANANHVVYVPNSPLALEQPELAKRYPANPPKDWWFRWLSGDWGYDHQAVFYKFFFNPESRTIEVYDEYVTRETLPEEVGVYLAQWCREELHQLPSHHMALWMGTDIKQNRIGGGRTPMELIASGIGRVLGKKNVHLPDLVIQRLEEQMESGEEYLDASLVERIKRQKRAGLSIRYAPSGPGSRVPGWQQCRSILRWWSLDANAYQDFSVSEAFSTFQRLGEGAFQTYLLSRKAGAEEILPKFRLWSTAPSLIDAIPRAQKSELNSEDVDKHHFHGMDCIDSWRYGVVGFQESDTPEPEEAFVNRRLDEVRKLNPHMTPQDVIMSERLIEAEAAQRKGKREDKIFSTMKGSQPLRHNRLITPSRVGLKGVDW